MTTMTMIMLEDDLDDGPAGQTVRFGLGASEYEIDLSAAKAGRFRAQLAPFVEPGRKLAGASTPGRDARPQPAGTAPRSGPGPRTTASRSASAGGSRPASPGNARQQPPDRNHQPQDPPTQRATRPNERSTPIAAPDRRFSALQSWLGSLAAHTHMVQFCARRT